LIVNEKQALKAACGPLFELFSEIEGICPIHAEHFLNDFLELFAYCHPEEGSQKRNDDKHANISAEILATNMEFQSPHAKSSHR